LKVSVRKPRDDYYKVIRRRGWKRGAWRARLLQQQAHWPREPVTCQPGVEDEVRRPCDLTHERDGPTAGPEYWQPSPRTPSRRRCRVATARWCTHLAKVPLRKCSTYKTETRRTRQSQT